MQIYCSQNQLELHPENIRRYYPPQDVLKMAESIKASKGVLQALLVTSIPGKPEHYYVVDGNLRLAAARHLGSNCPELKCDIIEQSRAEQLLSMVVTTEFVFPKDPVSKGLHFQRLIEQEKLTIDLVSEKTRVSRATIDTYLKTLELEPEIQQLIAEGKLTADVRVTRALLSLPDSELRIKLARRFARNGTITKRILSGINLVKKRAAHLKGQSEIDRLESEEARKQEIARNIQRTKTTNEPKMDSETAKLIYGAAEKFLCDGCISKGLAVECYLCPGPQEMLSHLVELAESRIAFEERA